MPDVVLLPQAICYNIHQLLARGGGGGPTDGLGKSVAVPRNVTPARDMRSFLQVVVQLRDQHLCGHRVTRLPAVKEIELPKDKTI